jgi:uroporphyrin-III C-methyltransferase / precorrin-2 dehydrogenase / sirohydrochlorin ferrochelatase
MEQLPIFLTVKGRRTVVVGGGEAAARKIELLMRAGAVPLVVAPAVNAEIAAWIADGRCLHRGAAFTPDCLDQAVLVIAATDDDAEMAAVAAAADARHIPVNAVDRPDLSSFIMPAIVDRAPVTIAISTGGASPTLAQMIKTRIEAALPAGLGALARLARAMRPLVREFLAEPADRRTYWRAALQGPAAAAALAGDTPRARELLLGELRRAAKRGESAAAAPASVDA